MPAPSKISIGQKFGNLTVKKLYGTINRHRYFICECSCGKTLKVRANGLPNGHTKSCGCFHKKNITKHGCSTNPTPEYRSWQQMISRCTNPRTNSYNRYGGRRIVVCSRWRNSFVCFLKDMGKRPSIDYSIERINNEKGYYPSNCKWASRSEQGRNRYTNRILTVNGISNSVIEWSEKLKIPYNRIYNRIRMGWPHDKCISTKLRKH